MSKLGKLVLVLILVIVVSFSFAGITLVRNKQIMEHLQWDDDIGMRGSALDWLLRIGSDLETDREAVKYVIEEHQEMPFAGGIDKIDIDATVANITVIRSENEVAYAELEGDVTYRGDVKPYLYVDDEGDTLTVKVMYGNSGSMNISQSNLELRIFLPLEMPVDIEIMTISGGVSMADLVAKELEIRTISGNVTIHDVMSEEMAVQSVSGNVKIHQTRLASDYNIKTVSGNVSLTAEEETALRLDYSSISGEGSYDYPFDEILEIDNNELELKSGNGQYDLKIRSTSGDFRLELNEK